MTDETNPLEGYSCLIEDALQGERMRTETCLGSGLLEISLSS